MNGFIMPFNRGRFNRKIDKCIFAYTDVQFDLSLSADGSLLMNAAPSEPIRLIIEAVAESVCRTKALSDMKMLFFHLGEAIRIRYPNARFAIKMALQGEVFIYVYSEIKLFGIPLKSGDELVIDTEKMTAVLNGINVLEHISSDSEFFKLLPQENEIYISDTTEDKQAKIKVLWKDRWL